MVCTLIDHRNDDVMFKTQVEPRVTGEWFHSKVLNILTSFESMVNKSTRRVHGKLLLICFLQ